MKCTYMYVIYDTSNYQRRNRGLIFYLTWFDTINT
jgi:hypothetical protein